MSKVSPEFETDRRQPEKIRIILADDHPLLRQALRNVLEKQDDFEVIAEVGDGEEAVRLAMELVPDVMIMDISMPKLSGLDATKQIKSQWTVLIQIVGDRIAITGFGYEMLKRIS